MRKILTFLLLMGFHCNLVAGDAPGDSYEQSLLETFKEIQSLNHEQALNSTRDLIRQYPHSRLGHMLYADLLLAKAGPLTEIGYGVETDYFITIGLKGYGKQKRGDQKTPIGVYHVTRYIDGMELPDLYGEGAFPINYPNAWDRRKQRTGSGIWIHGTPSYTYNRSPRASDGCIVVSNTDFLHIDNYIQPSLHTPVVVAEQVNWIDRDQWLAKRQQVMQLLSSWLIDWESLDHDKYRRHYSQSELDAYGRDFKSWDNHKRWVNGNKTWIDVEYSKLNIFNYPGEDNLMLMQFEQIYRSNNLNVESPKELFWRNTGASWEIVYEGNRSFPSIENTIVKN